MNIEGKVVLITGASSGIGLALAKELAAKGAVLVLASRRLDRLQEVAREIEKTFPDIPHPVALQCDVADSLSVHTLVEGCMNAVGGIDILINNAGISVFGDTDRTPLDDFHTVMRVNYFGTLHCMLETIPIMKKRGGGLIVNIASLAALRGVPFLGAYSASKAAVAALGQSLRTELRPSRISILTVYPGYTATNIFKNEKKTGGAHRPAGPYTSVTKVARAITRAIERNKKELILSCKGKALKMLAGILPGLVERVMRNIASELRDERSETDE